VPQGSGFIYSREGEVAQSQVVVLGSVEDSMLFVTHRSTVDPVHRSTVDPVQTDLLQAMGEHLSVVVTHLVVVGYWLAEVQMMVDFPHWYSDCSYIYHSLLTYMNSTILLEKVI
jgi:hypothetical protein